MAIDYLPGPAGQLITPVVRVTDTRGGDEVQINRAKPGDGYVVIGASPKGHTGAPAVLVGLTPDEALAFAEGLRQAAYAVKINSAFYVVDSSGTWLPGLPTPRLIDEGGGPAWQQRPGIWRLRERGDPDGTVYTSVRVLTRTRSA